MKHKYALLFLSYISVQLITNPTCVLSEIAPHTSSEALLNLVMFSLQRNAACVEGFKIRVLVKDELLPASHY
jgi:hypothetical protein